MTIVLSVYLLLGILSLGVLLGVELVGTLVGAAWVIALWPVFIGGRLGRIVAARWRNRG